MGKQNKKACLKRYHSSDAQTQNQSTTSNSLKIHKITKKQMRALIFENLKNKYNEDHHQQMQASFKSIQSKVHSDLKALINQEMVNCSICLDVMVSPVLLQCGHVFCLSCIECAYFRKEECPFCRKQLNQSSFHSSKHLKNVIKYYCNQMTLQEKGNYEDRVNLFNASQAKRALPCRLEIGSFVDYNLNNKWREAQVVSIVANQLQLKVFHKKGDSISYQNVSLNSRRLAKHRTFTKAPPLRPTYYSKDLDFSQPVLRYIVEDMSTISRRQIIRNQMNTPANNEEEMRAPRWDEFQNISNGNNWFFSDVDVPQPSSSSNIWNLTVDDQLSLPIL